MKKLLLLAGLLVVAGSAFAAEKPKTEVEGDVGVKANVVSDLKFIKGNDVDFGYLLRGRYTTEVVEPGSFIIEGAKGYKVNLFTKDANNESAPFQAVNASNVETEVQLNLTNVTGNTSSQADARLLPKLAIYTKDGNRVAGSIALVDELGDVEHGGRTNGKAEFEVKGRLQTSSSQFNGAYYGKLRVKAQYDDWKGNPAVSN